MRHVVKYKYALSMLPVFVSLGYGLYHGDFALLRPDQKGLRLFNKGEFADAATTFSDPLWKGAAIYRDGSFEAAAGIFAGQDTASSAYNQANSLTMQGKYTEAVARYDRALELQPDWEEALNSLARDSDSEVVAISSITGLGLGSLVARVAAALDEDEELDPAR